MSGGAGSRVSIPGSMRKTIQNIKEIAGNHSDEEVYTMLKECAMDPNETAQRLLNQDTFHEVKRKRDKRKEVNKEPVDSSWKAGVQGRGGRARRGGLNSRYVTNDTGGKNVIVEKEDRFDQATEKVNLSVTKFLQDVDIKPTPLLDCNVDDIARPTIAEKINSSHLCTTNGPSATNSILPEEVSSIDTEKIGFDTSNIANSKSHRLLDLDKLGLSVKSISCLGVYASSSDPILEPGVDSPHATTYGGSINCEGKFLDKSNGSEVNISDVTKDSQPSFSSSANSRPSNCSSRSQQPNGSQKSIGPNKEWKPKATHLVASQVSETRTLSVPGNAKGQPLLPSSSVESEDDTLKLQGQFGDFYISSDTKRVIIPDHLQVPKSESSGLSFGSFDSSFGLDRSENGPAIEKVSTPNSGTSSQKIDGNPEEHSSSICILHPSESEGLNLTHLHSFPGITEKSSSDIDSTPKVSPAQEYDQTKENAALISENSQHPIVQTTPAYPALGLLPQMLPYQIAPGEVSDNPNHDASTQNTFLVPNNFDPATNYFTQFYGLTSEGDGRFSPFLPPGVAAKYNVNIPILPSQSGQTQQEGGNSLFLSSSGPSSAPTVMQNHQQFPFFRQPTGIPIQHFSPNFNLPYGQYIAPYVLPTIHPLLSSMPFPQQAPPGGIFPPLAAPSSAPKFDISQYKAIGNTGNSTHVGVPTGYGTYSTSTTAYGPNIAVTGGILTGGEDPSGTQFKENSVYMAAPQTEGSTVWFPSAGCEIAALQANYNLTPQGQHFTFAPQSAAHAAFFHPNQPVPVSASVHPLLQQPSQSMAAGGGSLEMQPIYRQTQRPQMNWATSC